MVTNRKDEHVHLAEKFHNEGTNAFDQIHLVPNSLPKINAKDVTLETPFLNTDAAVPFYINAMTGGSRNTGLINEKLATVARETGLAMATGSQNSALKNVELQNSFKIVRQANPSGFIMANIGANNTAYDALKAVEMLQADALQVHLNVAQEMVMPEGDRYFSDWREHLSKIIRSVDVPVIIKEVGNGLSYEAVENLMQLGVRYVDVSGNSGTSFTQIENERRLNKEFSYLERWGLETPQALLDTQPLQNQLTILASGGIRQPLDIIKALVLGAQSVGVSSTFLHFLLHHTVEETIAFINSWKEQLSSLMTILSAKNVQTLPQTRYYLTDQLWQFEQQLNTKKD